MIRRPTRSARTDTLVPYTTRCRSITFNGSYKISPAISPDGNSLVYVTRRNGAFRIALQNMGSGSEQLLTAGPDDESPSFAPNGMQILYSSVQGGRSVLAVTSVDGRVRQTLSALNRSDEHTSELQSLMRISYAAFCLKKKTKHTD